MSMFFNPGDRVDVTIAGATVISHGPTQLRFSLPGDPDRNFVLPTIDGRARPVLDVTVAIPRPVAGDVYTVGTAPDRRLMAFIAENGRIALFDPFTRETFWPAEAVREYGQLLLAAPMPEPAPPKARASMPILALGDHDSGPEKVAPLAPPPPAPYAQLDARGERILIIGDAEAPAELEHALLVPDRPDRPSTTDGSSLHQTEVWTQLLADAGWVLAGYWHLDGRRWSVPVRPADTAAVS